MGVIPVKKLRGSLGISTVYINKKNEVCHVKLNRSLGLKFRIVALGVVNS